MKKLFVCILLFYSLSGHSQEFSNLIKEVYDFNPKELTYSEKEEKSKQIDSLWKTISDNKQKYLPFLREELRKSNNSFFIVDASMLLMKFSPNELDEKLILESLTQCDIHNVSNRNYLKLVHYLSIKGYNTFELSCKILEDTTFSAFLENHFVSVGQSYSLLFTILPTNKEYYVDKLVELYKKETSPYKCKTILMIFGYASNCEGDALIKFASEDMTKDKEVREYAQRIIKGYPERGNHEKRYNDLILKRNKILKSLSDETLEEIRAIAFKLKENYNCQ